MIHTVSVTAILVALALPALHTAQAPSLTVHLAHESESERALREQLLALADRYDLSEWIVTTEILVDETRIPHSRPVLPLHTRHLGDDDRLLSTFLHERPHGWVQEGREREGLIL